MQFALHIWSVCNIFFHVNFSSIQCFNLVMRTAVDAVAIPSEAQSVTGHVGHFNPQELLTGISVPNPDVILRAGGKKL